MKFFAVVGYGVRLSFSSFVYFGKIKLQDFGDFCIVLSIPVMVLHVFAAGTSQTFYIANKFRCSVGRIPLGCAVSAVSVCVCTCLLQEPVRHSTLQMNSIVQLVTNL